jgi:hypothetical protein
MAYRWLGVLLLSVACSAGCGNEGMGDPRGSGSSGGNGGAGGIGGAAGQTGTGGTGGAGATECLTNPICRSCPTEGFCDTDDDCTVGSACIESGCTDLGGSPIGQCVFAGGGACNSIADCPPERECREVPLEGKRCVKTTPGCTTRFDCLPGFSCENDVCVDRRVACDVPVDCPKNHTCLQVGFSSFCVRINVDCQNEFDCVELAQRCEDVDGDGNKECADVFDPNAASPVTCLNSACSDPGSPVCEADGAQGMTACGQYGLCLGPGDCATGFSCVELWPDGRKECVPEGGSCSSFASCPIRQVCAAPQEGGAPSCQSGVAP